MSMIVALDMIANIVNIKSVFIWWCLYVLSNNYAAFEDQFMKMLRNIIVNRPWNGYEAVSNIRVVSIDSLKQLEVAKITN